MTSFQSFQEMVHQSKLSCYLTILTLFTISEAADSSLVRLKTDLDFRGTGAQSHQRVGNRVRLTMMTRIMPDKFHWSLYLYKVVDR